MNILHCEPQNRILKFIRREFHFYISCIFLFTYRAMELGDGLAGIVTSTQFGITAREILLSQMASDTYPVAESCTKLR